MTQYTITKLNISNTNIYISFLLTLISKTCLTCSKLFFMAVGLRIDVNEGLYLRDPQSSELGKNIIRFGIICIDDLGFEAFTFKKLAERMESNETSIYRYFENKHMLLLYLVSWYWNWVSYLVDINTRNIEDPVKCLNIIVDTFVDATKENPSIDFVNEQALHRIIIAEAAKSYHTKSVDSENKEGFFASYKELTQKVSDVILRIDPNFPYPHGLASNLFEMANNQIYFAEHLPKLTDIHVKDDDYSEVASMLTFYSKRLLKID